MRFMYLQVVEGVLRGERVAVKLLESGAWIGVLPQEALGCSGYAQASTATDTAGDVGQRAILASEVQASDAAGSTRAWTWDLGLQGMRDRI
jgi:hypothetical protein